jgi:hypothetical protein
MVDGVEDRPCGRGILLGGCRCGNSVRISKSQAEQWRCCV